MEQPKPETNTETRIPNGDAATTKGAGSGSNIIHGFNYVPSWIASPYFSIIDLAFKTCCLIQTSKPTAKKKKSTKNKLFKTISITMAVKMEG